MTKRLLFIGHEAGRTGAPIVLLHFLRWLKANTDFPFHIILKKGGELERDFQSLAPVTILDKHSSHTRKFSAKVFDRLFFRKDDEQARLRGLERQFSTNDISLIYSNTATNGQVLDYLSHLKCPVVSHIHELDTVIRSYGGGLEDFKQLQRQTSQYIAASYAVKENLCRNYNIQTESVEVIHEFIETKGRGLDNHGEVGRQIREQLNIPSDAFIVGASGMMHWRKGVDLFIQLARAVSIRKPDSSVYFVWVGGENKGNRWEEIWYDVEKLGLTECMRFTGTVSNPLGYYAAFDSFTMLSREDPYPLVNLEAAAVGKPIICFDKAGGSPEFVEDDCGFVIPYLDVEAAANKVIELIESPELKFKLGHQAALKVRERHDISIAAPKILNVIERLL